MAFSIGFISLGCAKNLVDSEHMAGVLRTAGLTLARSPETADVILINTCGFIGDAREESIDAILRACERKTAGLCRAVIVAGCLTQRYRGELRAAIPEVDAMLGLDQLGEIARIVRRIERGERGILRVSAVSRRLYNPSARRIVLTGGPFAYLKIAEGCNHQCAFCAIPGIRGRYRSRRMADILREAETLLSGGVRELNLISQDTTRYGSDRGGRTHIAALVRALDRLGGRFWIRLLYGHPAHLDDALLDAMGESRRVCRYLDIPIQHSHPDILRAMRRAGGAAAVRDLPGRVRARLPGAALRTTCLVGFPGETAAHFAHLQAFVREADFDHLGVFTYSREEHTAAHDLPGPVSRAMAVRRRAALMRAQQAIVRRRLAAQVGRTETVLLIRPLEDGVWLARSARQAPEVDGVTRVAVGARPTRPGEFLKVRHTAVAGYDLAAAFGFDSAPAEPAH
jgi:ribosomal protein S12 methylthiotransferase